MPPPVLTKPAVNADEPERTTQELWLDWLSKYFTGAAIDVLDRTGATISKTFPLVRLFFGQTEVDLAPGGLGIHVVLLEDEPDYICLRDGARNKTARWTWHAHVLAKNDGGPTTSADSPDMKCRRAAAGLAWLLRNDHATIALARKGMRHVTLVSGPRPISDLGFQRRMLVISSILDI